MVSQHHAQGSSLLSARSVRQLSVSAAPLFRDPPATPQSRSNNVDLGTTIRRSTRNRRNATPMQRNDITTPAPDTRRRSTRVSSKTPHTPAGRFADQHSTNKTPSTLAGTTRRRSNSTTPIDSRRGNKRKRTNTIWRVAEEDEDAEHHGDAEMRNDPPAAEEESDKVNRVWVRTARHPLSGRSTSAIWKYISETTTTRKGKVLVLSPAPTTSLLTIGSKVNSCKVVKEDGHTCGHEFYWSGGKVAHTNIWKHLDREHGITKVNQSSTLIDQAQTTLLMALEKVRFTKSLALVKTPTNSH